MSNLKHLFKDKLDVAFDVDMKKYTTFRIGGAADVMLFPKNEMEFALSLEICRENGLEFIIIGNGSNLLVSDAGIRGVVIRVGENFNKIELIADNVVRANAGVLLSKLAHTAYEKGLAGLEFASGIPGTLGGGVIMNAGAYGAELSSVVLSSRYMDYDGNLHEISNSEHNFSYRHSFFQANNCIVISTTIKLGTGDSLVIKSKMDELNKKRREKQPLEMPSAGSVFKRPQNGYASKLIEDCGLKGYTLGGAQVSEKHSGFIVNRGGATCADVLKLIEYVQKVVEDKTGIFLEPEVKLVSLKNKG